MNINMTEDKKTQWKLDYVAEMVLDCPCCGIDRPDHMCKHCKKDMSQATCWENEGYCSQACMQKENVEFEKVKQTRELKTTLGMKCLCDEPSCAKCLGGNCTDQGCPTHTDDAKRHYKLRH